MSVRSLQVAPFVNRTDVNRTDVDKAFVRAAAGARRYKGSGQVTVGLQFKVSTAVLINVA